MRFVHCIYRITNTIKKVNSCYNAQRVGGLHWCLWMVSSATSHASIFVSRPVRWGKWYEVDQLWNNYCITFDFSDQFLTTNFYEFRKELAILYPANCKACKTSPTSSQITRGAIWNTSVVLLRFSNQQVSVSKKSWCLSSAYVCRILSFA